MCVADFVPNLTLTAYFSKLSAAFYIHVQALSKVFWQQQKLKQCVFASGFKRSTVVHPILMHFRKPCLKAANSVFSSVENK